MPRSSERLEGELPGTRAPPGGGAGARGVEAGRGGDDRAGREESGMEERGMDERGMKGPGMESSAWNDPAGAGHHFHQVEIPSG
ncbi:hypothetical protein BOFL111202_15010 [Bordetella flabilis]